MSSLALPRHLTIEALGELRAQVGAGDGLDCAGVERIDTAGAQWLLAAHRAGHALFNLTEPVNAATRQLGLTPFFEEKP